MRTLLANYLGPLMKRTAGFFIAMTLVATLSMILLFGAVSAYNCFDSSNTDYTMKYGYPDARIQTGLTDISSFANISKVEGVEEINVRTYWMNTFKADTRLLSMKLNTINEGDIVKLFENEVVEKSDKYPNLYLERHMADNNGVKAGDIIKVRFDDKYYDFYVEKLVQSCETKFFQVNNLIAGDNKDLGCAYIEADEVRKFFENEGLEDKAGKYNEVLLKINDELDQQAVLDNVLNSLPEDLDVTFSAIKSEEACVKQMDDLLQGIKKVSVLLPLIFYIIMLIVVLLFMMQVIRNSFREIGILMMLGYKKGSIIALFSCCALIISLISIAIGALGGRYILEIIIGIFDTQNTIPYIISRFDIKALLISSFVTVLVMQAACLLSMLQLKNVTPASIFQDDFGQHTRKPHGRLISILPSDIQIAVGSIKQNPRRAVVSVFAIIAAFVMIFLGLCINQGMNTTNDQIKNERLFYDAQVMVLNDVGYEESEYMKEALLDQDFITDVEQVAMASVDISKGDFSDYYTITAMKTDQNLVRIPGFHNEGSVRIPERGIIVVMDIAELAGVDVGDTIEVDGKKVEIKAISEPYSGKSQFMSYAQLRDLGIDYYVAFYVKTNDEEKLLEWLDDQEVVTYTIFTSKLKEKIVSVSSSYVSLTRMEIAFAIAIAFMVITVMTVSSFDEQRRRLSILRVLGYQISRISAIWLMQFIAYLIPAMVIALPAATALGKWFMIILSGKNYSYPFVDDPVLYIASFILVLLMYISAHFVSMISLRRQKLADSIKSRE